MADYAKMKNAELEALLKSRNLPHTGKKADMVSRLIEADKKTTESPSTTTAAAAEDEIDWDDDTDATKPAATTIKAGGKGPAANPQAVPNQAADVDPSKTSDLSVKPPAENNGAEGESKDPMSEEAKPEKPAVDFTRGLAASTLEDEIEKRKARARKFGMPIEEDETLKKLERAKKFGETGAPRGLDEALPERTAGRKRGREGGEEGGRGGHNKRGGRRFDGRRGGDRRARDGDRKPRDNKREQRKSPSGGRAGWMNETDKAKAEARKAKFAVPAAST
jgi:SAP domain-containing ribonucleoprotein